MVPRFLYFSPKNVLLKFLIYSFGSWLALALDTEDRDTDPRADRGRSHRGGNEGEDVLLKFLIYLIASWLALALDTEDLSTDP